MKRESLRAFFGGLVLLLGVTNAGATELAPSDMTYAVSRGVLTLGEARFQLQPKNGEGECYRYEYRAKPRGVARLLIGEVREISDFCIVDGRIRSQHFEFRRSDKPADDFSLDFDWDKQVVRSSKGELRQLTPEMMDRLAMQLAVQLWVIQRDGEPGPETYSITKVEDDRAKTYKFRITGKEAIKVPAGSFDTVLIERVDDPKKSTRFWSAPTEGYAPVRVQQTKEGDEQLRMQLLE